MNFFVVNVTFLSKLLETQRFPESIAPDNATISSLCVGSVLIPKYIFLLGSAKNVICPSRLNGGKPQKPTDSSASYGQNLTFEMNNNKLLIVKHYRVEGSRLVTTSYFNENYFIDVNPNNTFKVLSSK